MTKGYVKLFSTLVTSSIWSEDDKTRLVWITMLALSNRDGVVEAALPGLARAANVTVKDCEAAIKRLMEKDPYSRSKEFDGRRIEPCDGGWLILNHGKYAEMLSLESRREYFRIKQKEYRRRSKEAVKGISIKEMVRQRVELEDNDLP